MTDSSMVDSSVSAADQSSDLFENEFCTADVSSIEGCSQYLHQVNKKLKCLGLGGSAHITFPSPGNIMDTSSELFLTGIYMSANTEC